MNSNEYNEQIYKRIEKTKDLLDQVIDKNTFVFVNAQSTLKDDYEIIGDIDSANEIAKDIIYKVNNNLIKTKNANEKRMLGDLLLKAYDTRARCGDFESFCIALEWKRPIEKQFYIPRMRLLKKHGLIQGFQDLQDDLLDLLVLNLPPRIGKQLSDDTPILTKNGWKKHGDLVVGDEVLNHKGDFVKVLGVSPKNKSEYTVVFSNGERIDCHGNHEWVVYDRHAHKEKTIETKEMIDKIRDNYSKGSHDHYRFLLPNKEFVKGEEVDLPVKPYTLGVWLGDGTNTNPYISNDIKDRIIIESVVEDGYKLKHDWVNNKTGVHTLDFDMRKDLQKLGFCHSRKTVSKTIPDIYLTSSISQRLEILAGLLDTDGSLNAKEHRYQFTTSEESLKDSFVSLISTFGWRTTVVKYEPKLSSSGIQGRKPYWTISFNPTLEIPCRLERKQLKTFSKQRRISIVDIMPLKEEKWGNCIQVEGGIYLAGKTLVPTHNSTLSLFFIVFRAGLYPQLSILGNGHSTSLTQSFYSEALNIMTSEEYRFREIFPNVPVVKKSAEYSWVDLCEEKRFHTLNFRSVDAGTTGLVEASNLLYCDDLVKDVETANNPDRLEKLYYDYTSTIKDRKVQRKCKDGVYRPCPELHCNTPWSINDVTNRIIRTEESKGNNDRVRIISVPCYDENGESNFEYDYGKGFSKEYYKDMEVAEDPVIFSAKYLMKCIERDGLVFNKDNVSFYENLPNEKPDRVVGYVDVSHGGADYFSMPIAFVYGNEVYIEDVLFENKFGGDDYIRPKVRDILMKYGVTRLGIEKNNGGDFFATLVNKDLKEKHYRCNITTHNAPTNKAKLDRILACQNEIKGIAIERSTYKLYFKSNPQSKQYDNAMKQLFSWNQNPSVQNKQHDDFPDSLAGLITNVLGGNANVGRIKSFNGDKLGI